MPARSQQAREIQYKGTIVDIKKPVPHPKMEYRHRPSTKSRRDSIISGDLCAGNAFVLPVRTLGEQTIPSVSAPPGNPAGFQAHAVFPLRIEKTEGFFDAHSRYPIRG